MPVCRILSVPYFHEAPHLQDVTFISAGLPAAAAQTGPALKDDEMLHYTRLKDGGFSASRLKSGSLFRQQGG